MDRAASWRHNDQDAIPIGAYGSVPRPVRAGVLALALALAGAWPVQRATAQSAQDQPVAFALGSFEFLGDGQDAATVGAGAFNVIPNDDRADTEAELRLEYRYGGKWLALGPMAGIMANSDGGVFGYAGLYTDIRVADRWTMTPAAGVGAYERGDDGKDLGGVFQFHVAFDLAYMFDGGDRLGLKVAHISNAWIHDENPGVESVLLTYTIALDPLFGR